MKVIIRTLFIFSTFFLLFPHQAMAGGYFGVGMAQVNASVSGLGDLGDDNGIKIYGGTRDGNFGWEVTYQDFGDIDVAGLVLSGETLNLSMLGYIPMGQTFDLFGKLSLLTWNLDLSGLTDSGVDLGYGFGGQVNVAKNMSFRVEYELYNDLSGIDYDLLSFSVAFKF